MNDYRLVRFNLSPCSETDTDILAALLCDIGFESFVPDDKGVSAYIKKELYDSKAIDNAVAGYDFACNITITSEIVEGKDWNSEWEKNYFKPMVFGNAECVVHSSFHHDYPKARYDIVIDPKMAFGTGHHATTNMMIERILSSDFTNCRVLDMGTGTAILAILSSMRNAESVVAVEIDPVAYENALENIKLNSRSNIEVRLGGAETVTENGYFDFVLANINRNIILADIAKYAKALKPKGKMFLSGFYTADVAIIEEAAKPLNLRLTSVKDQDNWANICLEKD